jgi:hypothetical protein
MSSEPCELLQSSRLDSESVINRLLFRAEIVPRLNNLRVG